MGGQTEYYYRGTTRGWPGNPVLQELGITCVTTDPLVAALFAVECRNHGAAAVILAAKARFAVAESNLLDLVESAVNLRVAPIDFERSADLLVEVDLALDVLRDLGFTLPVRLPFSQLMDALKDSFAAGDRLTLLQIREFDRRIREAMP